MWSEAHFMSISSNETGRLPLSSLVVIRFRQDHTPHLSARELPAFPKMILHSKLIRIGKIHSLNF